MSVGIVFWSALGYASVYAQTPPAAPPPPPPVWAGSVGAGLALTSGNADTTNVNLAVTLTHDPASRHLVKGDALYLRGENEGDLVINRSTFGVRDEYALTERAMVFGQLRYLRDTFKEIDYLIAPIAGIGYKVVNIPTTALAIDAGVGGVWENNPGLDTRASGAINVGQTFSHKVSSTATITQAVTGLWKTNDFEDALYTVGVGVAATLTTKSQLKVELLETYKARPPSPTVQSQDVTLLTSLVYAF